jgi:hypothetical protein
MIERSSRVRNTSQLLQNGLGNVFGVALFKAPIQKLLTNGLVLNIREYGGVDASVTVYLYIEIKEFFVVRDGFK